MGYEVEKLKIIKKYDGSSVPQEKRKKKSEAGTKDDWNWVVANHQKELSEMCSMLRLDCPELFSVDIISNAGRINTKAPLFKMFDSILVSLHLLYEVFSTFHLMLFIYKIVICVLGNEIGCSVQTRTPSVSSIAASAGQ